MDSAAELATLLSGVYLPATPGAVCLVTRDGRALFRQAYGLADLELSVPVVPATVFSVGSVTKMFTATAIMKLAQASALELLAPVVEYLPDCPQEWAGITVDNLLSHTSGLIDLFAVPGWMDQLREDVPPARLVDFLRGLPLQFAPGARAAYCNSNYLLLGLVVEKLAGKPLAQVVTEQILRPLGMNSTHFAVTNTQIVPLRAKGYMLGPDGSFANAPYVSWTQAYGAGTMHTTVDDLACYAEALFEGDLLPPELLRPVYTPRRMPDGKLSPFGYGSLLVFPADGAAMIRISGSSIGYEAYSLYLREQRTFVAVFTNSAGGHGAPNPYFPGPLVNRIAQLAVGGGLVG